jgi:hypothetical protein
MSWHVEVDVARKRVVATLSGELTDQDVLDGDDALRANTDFRPEFDQLVDMSGATGDTFKGDAIRDLAGRPPAFSPSSRRAFVVASDLSYGLARMFGMRRGEEAGEIQIFRDREAAETWLSEAPVKP